ncbi:MAG: hypothetical protein KatS3mg129_0948 [Leptospiraceae bacterium]|nr:MAG: hypothetical protein KatS3mg129_0948 [Leptospiraceae bacterium]
MSGTNGKGSTGYFLSQLFFHNNYGCGFYSSPHLISYIERIMINLENLEEDKLNIYYHEFQNFIINKDQFLKKEYQKLTYFEVLTIFTIYLFYRFNLQFHIYEAGMGGRLDATKIVQPDIVILTNVSLDHTKVLGNTIEKILNEKLGILSDNTKLLFVGDKSLKKYIDKYQFKIPINYFDTFINKFNYLEYNKQFSLFCFIHIMNLINFNIKNTNISFLNPPGRFLIRTINKKQLIFDVSHNTKGLYTFLLQLKKQFSDLDKQNTIIISGLLRDRSYKNLKRLFLWTKLQYYYPLPIIPEIHEFIHQSYGISIMSIDDIKKIIKSKKYIIICGSFRLYDFYLKICNEIGVEYE